MKDAKNPSFFVAFLVVAVVVALSTMAARATSFPETQMKISQILQALGALVSLFSAVLMFFRTAMGASFGRVVPLCLPLLGGVLLTGGQSWTAVSLALIVITWLIREMVLKHRNGDPLENS